MVYVYPNNTAHDQCRSNHVAYVANATNLRGPPEVEKKIFSPSVVK